MAGSSMDGLDLAHVLFTKSDSGWDYELGKCETLAFPEEVFVQLKESQHQPISIQKSLDIEFGKWIAQSIDNFKIDLNQIDLLGVHGHTVIHKPKECISWQLGDGATIAKEVGITTVTDFRSLDIEMGGQGAPLVPYGDFNLFDEYDACLNLGGIANISIQENQSAWDICPCNQVLNFFAEKLGNPFDKNGDFAKSGSLDSAFYKKLSDDSFFSMLPPKSLPNNYLSNELLDTIEPKKGLYTYCQFIADQIYNSISDGKGTSLLVTGGGAFNDFLTQEIRNRLPNWTVCIPNSDLVEFKESLVFAFLALKRFRNEINTLASVTGASKDTSSGVIHLP